jgi:FkbM family methyltransferase
MNFITTAIKNIIDKAGYTIHSKALAKQQATDTMESALHRLKQNGINPGTVIDVGAAQGIWTMKAGQVWPSAVYQLVEPLIEQREKLDQLKSEYANINYHLAVAGEHPGEIALNIADDLDGSGIYGSETESSRIVPMVTIDQISESQIAPFLIKLDTHGYELSILKGAAETLKRTSVLVIEVYGFHISPTCLLFHELSAYLDSIGFRLVDLVDIMRRPSDNAFWQADAIYIRKDNPIFQSNSYS